MMLFPADRVRIASEDDALQVVLAGARRAFDLGLDEMAVHLLARPYRDVGSDERVLMTVLTPDGVDLPMPTIRAARAVASAVPCDAAFWIVPGLSRDEGLRVYVERPGVMEQRFHARPVAGREYVLGPFEEEGTLEVYELAYVALPMNVVEYAERFAGTTMGFGPSARELEAARQAVGARRAA